MGEGGGGGPIVDGEWEDHHHDHDPAPGLTDLELMRPDDWRCVKELRGVRRIVMVLFSGVMALVGIIFVLTHDEQYNPWPGFYMAVAILSSIVLIMFVFEKSRRARDAAERCARAAVPWFSGE